MDVSHLLKLDIRCYDIMRVLDRLFWVYFNHICHNPASSCI